MRLWCRSPRGRLPGTAGASAAGRAPATASGTGGSAGETKPMQHFSGCHGCRVAAWAAWPALLAVLLAPRAAGADPVKQFTGYTRPGAPNDSKSGGKIVLVAQ